MEYDSIFENKDIISSSLQASLNKTFC